MSDRLQDGCIFCMIIKGEIPSFTIYEDDATKAFMDINPLTPGHALVIPKFHTPNIYEAPADSLGQVMTTVGKVSRAVDRVIAPEGINILQANGAGAGQSVFHIHFHVIPRAADDGFTMNWPQVPGNMDDIGKLAEILRADIAQYA